MILDVVSNKATVRDRMGGKVLIFLYVFGDMPSHLNRLTTKHFTLVTIRGASENPAGRDSLTFKGHGPDF